MNTRQVTPNLLKKLDNKVNKNPYYVPDTASSVYSFVLCPTDTAEIKTVQPMACKPKNLPLGLTEYSQKYFK